MKIRSSGSSKGPRKSSPSTQKVLRKGPQVLKRPSRRPSRRSSKGPQEGPQEGPRKGLQVFTKVLRFG